MNPEYDLILMSLLIFVPTLFALPLLVPYIFPRGSEEYMRWWALLGTTVTLVISIWIYISYRMNVYEFNISNPENGSIVARAAADHAQEVTKHKDLDWVAEVPWIRQFNIYYYVGIDGISLPLVLLTTGLSFLGIIASWKIDRYVRGYLALFLLLETGMIGTFLALDFFLFYIFWEVMLLPMYFLIGVWGGPRREYAAIKFFLYTLFGSVLILIAMLGFYFTNLAPMAGQLQQRAAQVSEDIKKATDAGDLRTKEELEKRERELASEISFVRSAVQEDGKLNTFSLPLLHIAGRELIFSKNFQIAMFVLLFIGFAIKVPIFPFHTWLPDAHVEAPTPISMILAGVLLKMGGYGIIRIAYPICPQAAYTLAWYICLFAIINIVYGAFAAMAQTDFKKLVAYSSVSHMGYVILGIAVWARPDASQYWSWGMNGAMYQMVAHGITSAGMFFLVGVIYDRAHHRNLDNFRGLNEPMPFYGGISAIVFFAAMGLPGMCGFVGEFMVVLATWQFSPVFAILAALTVVLTAAYILWTIQRVFFGTNPAYKSFTDINLRELVCIVPLVVLAVILGVVPHVLLDWMEPSVTGLVKTLSRIGS